MKPQIDINNFGLSVKHPGRYSNNEINSYHKKFSEKKVNFVLAFPDLYEIGMSHLGLKILYKILNENENSSADRLYTPDKDLANLLSQKKKPLFSLENRLPICNFDIVGFTLQYELSYTNILLMLELGNIPIYSQRRTDNCPLILAGGPGAYNPQPLSPFMDAFVIGDGEEIILDIVDKIIKHKNSSRKEKLKSLSKLKGIYVPEFYKEVHSSNGIYVKPQKDFVTKKIKKNIFIDFDNKEKLSHPQLVPVTDIIHNRATVEIMRGCTRGCRFCQAGMIYRPIRERDEKLVLDSIKEEVEKNGWAQISLVSLSSSDYSCITPLIEKLPSVLKETEVNLSLPSLRIDSFEHNISKSARKFIGKTLTLAPEAGSQRLRDIINKNISTQEIISSIKKAISFGIRNLKLYFMIGLPHEKEEDIKQIVQLIDNIVQHIGKKPIQINIKLATFIPKPFTPFQWIKQEDQEQILKKIFYIKDNLAKYKKVRVKYHDPKTSFLEAVIARGDSNISKLLFTAYKNGAILSSWDEHFNFSTWEKSAIEADINLNKYTASKELNEPLPWDHIDIGVTKQFLRNELKRAEKEKLTEDCRIYNCSSCGVCADKSHKFVSDEKLDLKLDGEQESRKKLDSQPKIKKYRAIYEKGEELKFSSHRDLMKLIYQIVRKSKLPIYYTKGYNKKPKISFCSPLALGMLGHNEFFDLRLTKTEEKNKILNSLNYNNPLGFKVKTILGSSQKIKKIGSYKNEIIRISSFKDFKIANYIANYKIESPYFYKKKKKIHIDAVINEIDYKENEIIVNKKIIGAGIIDILKNYYKIDYEILNFLMIERLKLI